MVLVDDRILEALQENQFMTPSDLAELEEIRYSAQYIGDRCRELVKHGLVENVGNGVYVLTDRGDQYLKGDINTAEDHPDKSKSPSEDEDEFIEESST